MSKALRVLLVEDSEDDASLLLECLRAGGYAPAFDRVETAEALRAALRGKEWDVIVCDDTMPQFDAPGALEVLRESGRCTPLIVVSGTPGEDVAVEILKLGAADYLLRQRLTRLVPAIERAVATAEEAATRRKGEEQLRFTYERLQLAVKSSNAGIWEFDPATRELTWDSQMFVIYGRPAGTFKPSVEQGLRSIHPEDLPRVTAAHEQLMRDGNEKFKIEFRIIRASDDAVRNIRAMGTVIRDPAGLPARLLGINWDVTDERIREERLSEALSHEKDLVRQAQAGERVKGEFLAMMSQEIRTPMNGVLGFAELLANAPMLPADCRNYAQTIVQSGESLLRVLDEIIDYIQLESGDIIVERTPFSPRKMLHEIRALLAPVAAEKHLKLLTVIDENAPPFLLGDVVRLRKILLNLAGNAIKFTEGGSVTLGLWPLPRSAATFEFSVKDTGAGIAPAQIARIFRPFSQADANASLRHDGAGLGLTICRRLVEILGGGMTVRSKPGVGSEFLIEMPLDISEQPSDGGGDLLGPLDLTFVARHPLRVLLVEDDRVNLKLILTLVRRLGYDPLAAQNGVEAVEIFRSERPQCVFMDLQMPEMDGVEATTKIRAFERAAGQGGQAFIAALTANIFPAERRRCFDSGMNGYLNKPVKISSLAQTLIDACEFTSGVETANVK